MFRILATFACVVVAAGTSGTETCASGTRALPCAAVLGGSDHSLLQVHPASTVAATKKPGPSVNEQAKTAGTQLLQDQAIQHANLESLDEKVGEGLGSEARIDPYPADYNLDADYPRDDKGTHADTIREVQNATLPGAGDVGKNTKPGLSDSWNVDTMFVTDSDGGRHISLRDMVPWGYRSIKEAKKNNHEDHEKNGLLIEGKMAREGQASENSEVTNVQRRNTQASKSNAREPERKAGPKSHQKHAAAQSAPTSGEAKMDSAARR